MAPDQSRFHTVLSLTEYDAASIGSAAAAEWRCFLHRLLCFLLAVFSEAALHSASTERRAFSLESNRSVPRQEWYTVVNGKRISVSEEVYKAISSHNNHHRWNMRHACRCVQSRYACCEGDCQLCQYHVTGMVKSLDVITMDKAWYMDSGIDIEADFILKETMSKAFQIAESSVNDGAAILRMYVEDGLTYREIAANLGVHSSTVGWRIGRILSVLRESYEEVFQ